MSRKIYRVEIYAVHSGAVERLHFATEALNRTAAAPLGTGERHVPEAVVQPLLFHQGLFENGRTRGNIPVGNGEIVLSNSDQQLDYLNDGTWSFDNRPFVIFTVDPANHDSDTFFWSGMCESAFVGEETVVISVRDVSYQLDRPFQSKRFAGDNVLPNGLEGTAADLKGKVKPIIVGSAYNFSPPMVNTSRLILHITTGRPFIEDTPLWVLTVKDSGVALTKGRALTLTELTTGAESRVFTADTATNICTTTTNQAYVTGTPVVVTTTGGLPAPLVPTAYYYIRWLSVTTFTLHPTANDAINNTGIIDITTVGTGVHTVASNQTAQGHWDYFIDYYPDATNANNWSYFVRLGTKPEGQITCDLSNGADFSLEETVSEVLRRLDLEELGSGLNGELGITPVILLESSPSPAIPNQKLGMYVDYETTFHEVLQALASALNASFFGYPNSAQHSLLNWYHLGAYLMFNRIKYPIVDTPNFTLTKDNVTPGSIKRLQLQDPERGLPIWRVNVEYKKNYTVQNAAEVPGASAADQVFVASEFRNVSASDGSTLSIYPAATELTFNAGAHSDAAGAADLASYLQDLYGRPGDLITAEVPLSEFMGVATTVTPTNSPGFPQYFGPYPGPLLGRPIGMDPALRFAKTRNLIAYDMNVQRGTVVLTLWG